MANAHRSGSEHEPRYVVGYRIERRLTADGAPRPVYEATDLVKKRFVALKLVSIGSEDAGLVEQWRHRARTQRKLRHPHLVSLHAAGMDEGQFFVAMELVRGKTLRGLMDEGELRPERVLLFAEGIAAALDMVCDAGLTHPHLRPETILVDRLRRSHAMLGQLVITNADDVVTNSYAAPEQRPGETVKPSANVYSFAAILFEALTGRVPGDRDIKSAFHGTGAMGLERVFTAALSPDPELRPARAGALVAELSDAFGVGGAPRPSPSAEHGGGGRGEAAKAAFPFRLRRVRALPATRRGIGVLAVLVAAALAWLAGNALRGTDPPPPNHRPTTIETGRITVTAPASWVPGSTPASIRGVLPGATALRPAGQPGLTLVAGDLRDDRVGPLLDLLRRRPSSGETVAGGATQARRYVGRLVSQPDHAATLLLVPTSAGAAVAACIADQTMISATSFRACGRALATVAVRNGSPAAANPSPEQAATFASIVKRLDAARRRDVSTFSTAPTSGRQELAARRLSRDYAAALRAFRALTPTVLASGPARSFADGLSAGMSAYAALERASRNRSREQFATSRSRVIAADAALERAVSTMSALGYRPTRGD